MCERRQGDVGQSKKAELDYVKKFPAIKTGAEAKKAQFSFMKKILIFITGRISLPLYMSGLSISPLDYSSDIFALLLLLGFSIAFSAATYDVAMKTLPPAIALSLELLPFLPLSLVVGYFVRPFLAILQRKRSCEGELPFLATFITLFAAAGFSAETAFEHLAEVVHLHQFKKESLRVERVKRLCALNLREAIAFECESHPSEYVKELCMASMTAPMKKDLAFMRMKAETTKLFLTLERDVRAASEKLTLMASAEMISFVIMPIGFTALTVLFNSVDTLSLLGLFFFLPTAIAVFFGITIDSCIPRELTERIPFRRPYVSVVTLLPAATLLWLVLWLLGFPLYDLFGISLIVSSIPAILTSGKLRKRTMETLSALPAFTRLASDNIKKGLTLKLAIIDLSETRSFSRSFDRILYKVSALLKGGCTLTEAISAVEAPQTAKILFELMDKAEMLGNDPGRLDPAFELTGYLRSWFESLYSRKNVMMLIGFLDSAVLSLLIVLTVIDFSTYALSAGAGTALLSVQSANTLMAGGSLSMPDDIILMGAIYGAFLMGILGGKASGGYFIDGLKPAVMYAAISLLVIVFLKDFGLAKLLIGVFGA